MKKENQLHPRNIHQGRYELDQLMEVEAQLREHVFINPFGNQSIDFSNPLAVKALNSALLKKYYQIGFWDIPEGFLCPPIPGRADYIHYLGDLLAEKNAGEIPRGSKIRALDIGTGANLIYPLIGSSVYGWSFVGSELNPLALDAAQEILTKNGRLAQLLELRRQESSEKIFRGIIRKEEFFDLTLCNPPFHESEEAAQEGSRRKVRNLTGKSDSQARLNFGGQAAELWTKGGELAFIQNMIRESVAFRSQVFWFSTLVSKSENLPQILKSLSQAGIREQKIVEMAQGNKISRFVAWTFLDAKQQKAWASYRWK